jgi:imidazolonepropionase-like amidohydrolase
MLALRAGALFDGHNRRGPSDVLIDAGRISAVQPTAERADAVEVVDLGRDHGARPR